MARNRFNAFSTLDIGIGLRSPHLGQILAQRPALSWFEIISENYMVEGGMALAALERILEHYTVVQHGVGLNIGSAQGIDGEHLQRLRRLVARTGSPWVSDHLSWGSVDGHYSHDLLPLPYTWEAVDLVVENLKRVQGELEVPFVVENLGSYATYGQSIMSEWEFLAEVAEGADVGILLDLNNIYVSSVNHAFDPWRYLHALPHERIAQFHVAGHSVHPEGIVDTHDHPVDEAVWALYARAIELAGPTPTLLEWDARIPSFEEVYAEAMKAKRYWPALEMAHAS